MSVHYLHATKLQPYGIDHKRLNTRLHCLEVRLTGITAEAVKVIVELERSAHLISGGATKRFTLMEKLAPQSPTAALAGRGDQGQRERLCRPSPQSRASAPAARRTTASAYPAKLCAKPPHLWQSAEKEEGTSGGWQGGRADSRHRHRVAENWLAKLPA